MQLGPLHMGARQSVQRTHLGHGIKAVNLGHAAMSTRLVLPHDRPASASKMLGLLVHDAWNI